VFLLDDILLSPMKGLVFVCRKVEESARQELENQEKGTVSALGELHRRLEAGQIDDQEFDLQEAELLERMESLAKTLRPHDESEDN
jgi:hypothetical protein